MGARDMSRTLRSGRAESGRRFGASRAGRDGVDQQLRGLGSHRALVNDLRFVRPSAPGWDPLRKSLRLYAEALCQGPADGAVGTTASTPKTWPRVDHRPTRLQALVNPTNVINAVQTFYPPAKRFARFSAIHGGKTGPPALLAGLNKTIANLSATPMKA